MEEWKKVKVGCSQVGLLEGDFSAAGELVTFLCSTQQPLLKANFVQPATKLHQPSFHTVEIEERKSYRLLNTWALLAIWRKLFFFAGFVKAELQGCVLFSRGRMVACASVPDATSYYVQWQWSQGGP